MSVLSPWALTVESIMKRQTRRITQNMIVSEHSRDFTTDSSGLIYLFLFFLVFLFFGQTCS